MGEVADRERVEYTERVREPMLAEIEQVEESESTSTWINLASAEAFSWESDISETSDFSLLSSPDVVLKLQSDVSTNSPTIPVRLQKNLMLVNLILVNSVQL